MDTSCKNGDVHLVGGINELEGRVEIYVIIRSGEQYVIIPGVLIMLILYVNNLNINLQVQLNQSL